MPIRVGIGHDSHRFSRDPKRRLVLGGVEIRGTPGVVGNSDGDVILHAICNALATVTGFTVLGPVADSLCKEKGITDSSAYVAEAMKYLCGYRIVSVSIAVECRRPRLLEVIPAMRERIGQLLRVEPDRVAITATSGEELTAFGEGRGIQAFAVVTAVSDALLAKLG